MKLDLKHVAEAINLLGSFCGMRDLAELTPECLRKTHGIDRADVMALFGGSILCGGDVLAGAMQRGVAKHYVIVGGAGHTTESLRGQMEEAIPGLNAAGMTEAELFNLYLKRRYNLEADFLERRSTNCGNNITNLLELLRQKSIGFGSIILTQDATMQRRMDAGLRKYAPEGVQIINYAAYAAEATAEGGGLAYREAIPGMWEMERYISLLLGEISRLSDDAEGYGPRGRDFIAHVEIPPGVRAAFEELRALYAGLVRAANPAYASK